MAKQVVFIIGSTFSGSTFLTHTLAERMNFPTIGEAQRLWTFRQFDHVPEHYLNGCSVCGTHETYDCPIWTEEETKRSDLPPVKIYENILNNCPGDVVVDSSKEVNWLTWLIGEQANIAPVAIVISRSPFHFVESNQRRLPSFDAVWHAQGWRNIYVHSLRTLARLGVPYVILRYDLLLRNAGYLEIIIDRLLSARKNVRSVTSKDKLVHPLGGNLSEMSRLPGFDKDGFKKHATQFTEGQMSVDVKRVLDGSAGAPFSPDQSLMSDKWDFSSATGVLAVSGVLEIAQYLGYSMEELLAKFK